MIEKILPPTIIALQKAEQAMERVEKSSKDGNISYEEAIELKAVLSTDSAVQILTPGPKSGPRLKKALDGIEKILESCPAQKTISNILKKEKELSNYITIPNTNIMIAKKETLKGLKWHDTHYALAENGLFMPTPKIFMDYFLSVKSAAEGQRILYDGNLLPIQRNEVKDIYERLTTNHRGGCWTWLDALFTAKFAGDKLHMETDHRVIANDGAKTLVGRANRLEISLWEDCYINLEFNSQGLPIKKSKKQEYIPGQNISFRHIRQDCTAVFDVCSIGTRFYCSVNPLYSCPTLGVFACVERDPPKNSLYENKTQSTEPR